MRSKADLGEGNVAACTINRRRPTAWAPLRALASPDLRRPPSPRRERARAFGLNRTCRATPAHRTTVPAMPSSPVAPVPEHLRARHRRRVADVAIDHAEQGRCLAAWFVVIE